MKKYTFIMAMLFSSPLFSMEQNEEGFKIVGPSRYKQKQIKREEAIQAKHILLAAKRDQEKKEQQELIKQEVKKRVEQLCSPQPELPPIRSLVSPFDGCPRYGRSIFREVPSQWSYPPHAIIHFKYRGHARYLDELEDEIEKEVGAIMANHAINNH